MGQDWLSSSEIVTGLIIEGRLPLNAVRPELFCAPYNEVIKLMKDGNQETEYLINNVGLAPIQSSLDASHSLNGLGEANWVSILEKSRALYSAGTKMEKLSHKLKEGEDVNWAEVVGMARDADTSRTDFVPLSDVKDGAMPFIPTGYEPWDMHLLGVPEAGLIITAGNPGVGKTTLMTKLASCFVKKHPDKTAAIFSLEMILMEIAGSFRKYKMLNAEQESRIMLQEKSGTIDDLINRAAKVSNLGIIAIDFADLMIRGEVSEAQMAHIYTTAQIGAKDLHVPLILLSQLNRTYTGGIPRPVHIRYTSMAEATAWMLTMLWNPSDDYFEKQDEATSPLPIKPNLAYIIAWKVRGGFRQHPNDHPGAIMIPFKGKTGWGDTHRWFSLQKA